MSNYAVQQGDTYEIISKKVYGTEIYASRIEQANQGALIVGKVLIVPKLTELAIAKPVVSGKAQDEFTLVIDGKEIPVLNARIIRTMDTVSDGWTASIDWDNSIKPFQFPNAAMYIGTRQLVSGRLYSINPELVGTGKTMSLAGWSFTIDLVDSTLKPPYEQNNIDLFSYAKLLLDPMGIGVEKDVEIGGAFDRITAQPTDTIFQHLFSYANQRGLLLSSTPSGNLLFTKAITGLSVGTLEEGRVKVARWSSTYNGRKLFNVYRAIGQSPGENSKPAIAVDDNVPVSRFITFSFNDTTKGDIGEAVKWRRSKQYAEALTFPLEVDSWFAPNGQLWKENTLITVISETLFIPNGFTFLIRSVEYVFDFDRKYAVLNLTPPAVFSGGDLGYIWS